jgi:branched-chain amino acid aminotransferase
VLPGITRAAVIELAKQLGVELSFAGIDVTQLLEADEVFLTNSIMQIMPVCRIERRAIGDEKPGKVTLDLSTQFAELV